jgi:ASCH domain
MIASCSKARKLPYSFLLPSWSATKRGRTGLRRKSNGGHSPIEPTRTAVNPHGRSALRGRLFSLEDLAVKCLSIRAPFSHLIIIGAKTAEYRSWATSHRGPLAIHAAARRPSPAELLAEGLPADLPMALGCVLGVVEVVDCVDDGDGFAWLLRNPRALTRPLPWRGSLGLWCLPDALIAARLPGRLRP